MTDIPEVKVVQKPMKQARWSRNVKNASSSQHLLEKESFIDTLLEAFWLV
jgi:hypothetical protein